jgi:hypothetical protein
MASVLMLPNKRSRLFPDIKNPPFSVAHMAKVKRRNALDRMKRDAKYRPQAHSTFRPCGNSPSAWHFTPIFLLFVKLHSYYTPFCAFVNLLLKNKADEKVRRLPHLF